MKFVYSTFCLLVLLTSVAFADAPASYYDSVDLTDSDSLRSSMHDLIDNHTWYPYTSSSTDTWDILESADEFPVGGNTILDLYRNRVMTKFGGGVGPYNREHSWPNSYGFSSSGSTPYTDCHHLFLCDVSYNGDRGNKPFNDVGPSGTERVTDVNDGVGGGSGTYPGWSNWYNSTYWETWDGRKGDVARAMFYMDVRYAGDVSGEPDLVLTDTVGLIQSTSSSPAYMGLLTTLLEWNDADPVDAKEMRHNDIVYSYQGNRNPFVDHPEWVSGVFLGYITGVPEETPSAPSIIAAVYPNPFNPATRIKLRLEHPGQVTVDIYALDGKKVRTLLNDSLDAGDLTLEWRGDNDAGLSVPSGAYFCRLVSGWDTDTKKLLLVK